MDLLGDLINSILQVMAPVSHMPYSTLFIVLVSIGISVISTVATMKLTDVETLKANLAEVKAWQEKVNVARRTMNPVLLQEVMDDQSRVIRLQAQMFQERMKPICVFSIPFLIIFWLLNLVYAGTPVAILPFNIQKFLPFLDGWVGVNVQSSGFGLYFWSWYFLVSLAFSSLLRRATGMEF